MSNTNPRAAPRYPHPPRDNPGLPDPYSTKHVHISKIANENGSEITIWHYWLAKYHERNQPRMSPHEMMNTLVNTLFDSNNNFSVIHQKTETTTTVSVRDIEAETDIYNFVSSCAGLHGSKSTTLLLCITNNNHHIQHLENPIDDLVRYFNGRWNIFPD